MRIERLHYISQQPTAGTHLDAIETILKAGGKWVQLRVKNQPEDKLLEMAIQAKVLCERHGAKLIVNDHPLIALKAGADGLHLGLTDTSITAARKLLGPGMIIGGTANTFDHINLRVHEGADYVGLGPFRFTRTKENLSPILGLDGYKDIMERVQRAAFNIPIIAIGGIQTEDIKGLIDAGLYGVAVSGALTDQPHTQQVISIIQERLIHGSSFI